MPWQIHYSKHGIYLPQIDLWLDARRGMPTSFVSHAHADHLGRHKRVICSAGTHQLMQARLSGKREAVILPYAKLSRWCGDTDLQLFPAGHILGSAQLWARREGEVLLYTGDFKLRHGKSAEPCAAPQADVLIMETTFGLPRYQFPPDEKVLGQIAAFCRESIARGQTPVLFAYSLGKSQELLCAMAAAGLPVMLHPHAVKMTRVYEQSGAPIPPYKHFSVSKVKGHVVICPPETNSTPWLESIGPRRTAAVTGWALDSAAVYRYRCDAAFPLSDHADFNELLMFVEKVRPKLVYTVHGFAREFAQTLRRCGVEAWALGLDNQLEMKLPADVEPEPIAVGA
jgi:Cft2 family RNA processing exonuclease